MVPIRFLCSSNRILQSEVPSVPPDFTGPSTTSNGQSSSNTGTYVLPLAVGLPIGFMVVACAILFVLYRRKIRSRMSLDLTQGTTQQGGLLPFIMPHSLMVDRKQAGRGVFPPPPESTAPPPYTEPSQAGSSISPEMPTTSISLTGTSQQLLQGSGVSAPVS